jgi:hypothetical protein
MPCKKSQAAQRQWSTSIRHAKESKKKKKKSQKTLVHPCQTLLPTHAFAAVLSKMTKKQLPKSHILKTRFNRQAGFMLSHPHRGQKFFASLAKAEPAATVC